MADKKLSVKQICNRLGIAKSTLYKYAKPVTIPKH
ncbi:MAG: helix-turn-helix domain-containing protein [Desulfamplus sp.]|nr:helix-turn-helix domain-containing protein [Desulfamplus sp.]